MNYDKLNNEEKELLADAWVHIIEGLEIYAKVNKVESSILKDSVNTHLWEVIDDCVTIKKGDK